jgi:hypothetical protein
VHERQVEKRAQRRINRPIEAARQRAIGNRARERIGRVDAGAPAKHVARKLIEHDEQGKRRRRGGFPMCKPAGRRGLVGGEKARANGGVERVVFDEPLVGTRRLPERDDVVRLNRRGRRTFAQTRTRPA